MKNTYFSIVLSFIFSWVYSQNELVIDTITSNINVLYDRVEFSDGWACVAALQTSYVSDSNDVVLFFEVPNYDVRYKTTKEDYAIIKIKDKEIRLQNSAAFDADGLIQKFVFKVSKASMQEFLDDGFKKITFYFAPNEDFIVKRLAAEKNLNPEYRVIISQLAKKTAQTTIWNPDKKKLQDLKMWFEKL